MATTAPEPARLFKFATPAPGTPTLAEEVRDNFSALVQSNYTTDPAFPDTPQPGMRRINAEDPTNVKDQVWLPDGGGSWRTVFQHVEANTPAPAKVIVQVTTPATVWTIDHNLGGLALCQTLDASLKQHVVVSAAPAPGECIVQHVITPLVQRVVITHPAPTTGWVIIIG